MPPYMGDLAQYGMIAALSTRFEDTLALTRLILGGVLDRRPRLQLVCPHLGGALPYFVGQIDHQTMVLGRGAQHITRPPSAYLKRIYFDTVTPWPPAMRYCYEMIGPEWLLFGSDHPWIEPKLLAGMIDGLELPPGHRELIMGENARRLFRLGQGQDRLPVARPKGEGSDGTSGSGRDATSAKRGGWTGKLPALDALSPREGMSPPGTCHMACSSSPGRECQ